jgi:branched-chain amino acid aminotransferase
VFSEIECGIGGQRNRLGYGVGTMGWQVIINGELVPEREATIHVSDLGLRRGYAAFEFFRVVGGVPLFLDDHLARLARSTELLGLDGRWPVSTLRGLIDRLIEVNDLRDAGLQMLVTGGNSPDIFTPGDPTLVIAPIQVTLPPEEVYETGVAVITHHNLRELPEAKTTDYLIAVRLIPRMRAAEAVEVLYHDGTRMLEGARSGLGIITPDGILVTATRDVLESVTRKHALAVADGQIPIERRDIGLDEFHRAAGVFLTSSTRGVLPVTRVDDRIVGDGRVGPKVVWLVTAFRAHVAAHLAAAELSRS